MRAPVFVGARFSSFSAVISHLRSGRPHLVTAAVSTDVTDQLAVIFALQLGAPLLSPPRLGLLTTAEHTLSQNTKNGTATMLCNAGMTATLLSSP